MKPQTLAQAKKELRAYQSELRAAGFECGPAPSSPEDVRLQALVTKVWDAEYRAEAKTEFARLLRAND